MRGGCLHLIRLRNLQDAQLHNATLVEMSENMSWALAQMVALSPTKLLPTMERCRVKSLYILGESHFHQGLILRPEMVVQEELAIQCRLYLDSGHKLPQMGFDAPSAAFHPSEWKPRAQQAQQARRDLRATLRLTDSA